MPAGVNNATCRESCEVLSTDNKFPALMIGLIPHLATLVHPDRACQPHAHLVMSRMAALKSVTVAQDDDLNTSEA